MIRALLAASRGDLVLENLALRQQLLALHAQRPRRRLTASHKLFWIELRKRFFGGMGQLPFQALKLPQETYAYNLDEIQSMLRVLPETSGTALAVASFAGLRIAGVTCDFCTRRIVRETGTKGAGTWHGRSTAIISFG